MTVTHDQMTIYSFREELERLCDEQPHARAWLDAKTGRVWTYGALLKAVRGLGALLAEAGVRPGDRVSSLLPNSIEQLTVFLAALWAGFDFCPISPLSTAEEACRFARMCRSAITLVPPGLDRGLAEQLAAATTTHRLLPVTLDGDLTRYIGRDVPPDATTPARGGKIILFTSGTTHDPKAIVLDGDRLWSSGRAWAVHHPSLDGEARFYNVFPMSYLGGLFNLGLIPLACHGSVVIADAFSAASVLNFWREVEEHGVNTLWLAPTMLRALLSLHKPGAPVERIRRQVRTCFLGMAPVALDEKERFERTFGLSLLENFALSETTFLTSEQGQDPALRTPGSVGRLLPWVTVRLQPVADASAEIEVQTPFLFDGYLDGEGRVHRPLTADGFFQTGDLGAQDAQGGLVLQGRLKEIVKKGGYLILLRDLEEVVQGHPAVTEAAAIGVAHEFYGESPVLCVRLARSVAAPRPVLQDLKMLVVGRLAKFKWPSEIIAMDAFPKTENGKIQKRFLVQRVGSRAGVVDALRVA